MVKIEDTICSSCTFFFFLIMLETEPRATCMVNKQVISIYHRDTHQVLKMIILETTQKLDMVLPASTTLATQEAEAGG